MTKDEKLERVTKRFSQLPDDKQDYILGVLQALVFAHNQNGKDKDKPEIVSCDSEQSSDSV